MFLRAPCGHQLTVRMEEVGQASRGPITLDPCPTCSVDWTLRLLAVPGAPVHETWTIRPTPAASGTP